MTTRNLVLKNSYVVAETTDLGVISPVWEENLPLLSTAQKKFQWYYEQNPVGRGICLSLGEAGSPKAIGSAGVGFRRFLVNGKEAMAALVADLAVNRAHRTLYPALLLQRRVIETASERAAFIYGMPNSEASAVFKRLGYRKIAVISRYALVIRSAGYVKKRLNGSIFAHPAAGLVDAFRHIMVLKTWKGTPRGYAAGIVTTFDRRFDNLWAKASLNLRCAAVRDSRFLNWRYSACPERRYSAFTLSEKNGKESLMGYIVYYLKDRAVQIDDILAVDNEGALETLLTAFVKCVKEMDADSISIGICGGPGLTGILEKCGFRKRADAREIEVDALPCKGGDAEGLEAQGCFFTWGDQDNS